MDLLMEHICKLIVPRCIGRHAGEAENIDVIRLQHFLNRNPGVQLFPDFNFMACPFLYGRQLYFCRCELRGIFH